MSDLRGHTAVVTGGNAGIGLAMATGIGAAGARIVVWARHAGRSDAAVERLAADGVDALTVPCDVADEQSVRRAMAATVEAVGQVDCLVANAGVADGAPYLDTTLAQWQAVLRTNLDGTFLTTREVARHMVGHGHGGAIVVVASMVSRYGGAGQAAYATSKTGLVGLGRTLAVELARHRIRCNILVPGWTSTAMTASLRDDERFVRTTTSRTPVRRWAQPDDFREVAAFLADPRLSFHTGNEVVVDGGYSVF